MEHKKIKIKYLKSKNPDVYEELVLDKCKNYIYDKTTSTFNQFSVNNENLEFNGDTIVRKKLLWEGETAEKIHINGLRYLKNTWIEIWCTMKYRFYNSDKQDYDYEECNFVFTSYIPSDDMHLFKYFGNISLPYSGGSHIPESIGIFAKGMNISGSSDDIYAGRAGGFFAQPNEVIFKKVFQVYR